MTRVFFSYKRDDAEYAARIEMVRKGLAAEGFEIFIDRESIELGENWIRAIQAAIETCDVGLVVWTPAAHRSDHVLGEASALTKRSKYIGVLLAQGCLPAVFTALQHCDLTRWRGDSRDERWARLVAHLHALPAAEKSSTAIERTRRLAIPVDIGPQPAQDVDGGPGSGAPLAYFRDGDILPILATVPTPGVFTMGAAPEDNAAEFNEHPRVAIRLSHAFAIGVCPITNADWNLAAASCALGVTPRNNDPGMAAWPVVNVSWIEAQAYVAWLNFRVGMPLYRLPSEAEWEYTAQANDPNPPCEGSVQRRTRPLSALEYAPNAWGIAGMIGNVWQWTGDVYAATHDGAPLDGSARQRPDSMYRTARGGSWRSAATVLRPAQRAGFDKRYSSDDLGFRVVRKL